MASRQHKPEWELPSLRESHQIPGIGNGKDFYGVQFYPYTEPGVDPVFAIVGGKHILICRPPAAENTKVEVTQYCVDEETNKDKNGDDQEEDYYTCVWTKDFETGDPLLCVAGLNATIKIISALTGKLLRTLSGHGGEINDLVVSPTNPYILASASNDLNVRIWSLDPAHEKQPCAAILEGDGHREAVMSLSFHATGRYLLTGGVDHIINLWTLPEFPDKNTGTNKPTRIYYPHFSTSEIHENIVDWQVVHSL
ncbi:Polycomb protein, partial [Lachnellula subtilissima]